jgi:hypothetical protein
MHTIMPETRILVNGLARRRFNRLSVGNAWPAMELPLAGRIASCRTLGLRSESRRLKHERWTTDGEPAPV